MPNFNIESQVTILNGDVPKQNILKKEIKPKTVFALKSFLCASCMTDQTVLVHIMCFR